MKDMKEIWKPVRGKEDYAEISNLGQIHRFRREWYCGKNHQAKHIQKESWTYGSETPDGYLYATIGGVTKELHQWVYLTFVGDIPEGMEVNHIDEDKHRNCVWNLNLMTPKENCNWGTRNIKIGDAHRGKPKPKVADALRGRKQSPEHIAKVAAARSKAVQALNPETLEVVMNFPSTAEAQRQGFNSGHISACCRNCYLRLGNNVYKGYIWRFKE